jgi:protoporphyrinogen oxidase
MRVCTCYRLLSNRLATNTIEPMRIAIVGAGFTGLSAAYYLSKKGHKVTIFEKDSLPGGLAVGYKEKEWNWTLEKHYHHWFTNDKSILSLAKEINYKILIPRPKTSSFVGGSIYQLDSPLSLLKFPGLSVPERLRMGISLGFLKYNPFWKPLEKYKAEPYLKKSMGEKGYDLLWKPLMDNKLGKYSNQVSLAWFWARIYKRTSSLAYPEGGFLSFAQQASQKKNGETRRTVLL